jgi:hypothetical protein
LLLIFGFPTKNEKNTKKYILKNIFGRNKKNRSEKRMVECQKRPQLVEEVQECKRLKFDSLSLTEESPIDKENSILKKTY